MNNSVSTALALAALVALAGCETTPPPPPAQAVRTGSPADEQACLIAVGAQTSGDTVLLSSEYSEANTLVIVGVGPKQAKWKCLSKNGKVAEVMSLTDEGAL